MTIKRYPEPAPNVPVVVQGHLAGDSTLDSGSFKRAYTLSNERLKYDFFERNTDGQIKYEFTRYATTLSLWHRTMLASSTDTSPGNLILYMQQTSFAGNDRRDDASQGRVYDYSIRVPRTPDNSIVLYTTPEYNDYDTGGILDNYDNQFNDGLRRYLVGFDGGDVAGQDGVYYAWGYFAGLDAITRSTDNGQTWQGVVPGYDYVAERTEVVGSVSANSLIIYEPHREDTVNNHTQYWHSTNGLSWARRTIPGDHRKWHNIVWNGEFFLAMVSKDVTTINLEIYKSIDGINWTQVYQETGIVNKNSEFIKLAWNGTSGAGCRFAYHVHKQDENNALNTAEDVGMYGYSTDATGENWTAGLKALRYHSNGFTGANGYFVYTFGITGTANYNDINANPLNYNTELLYSTDGQNWTSSYVLPFNESELQAAGIASPIENYTEPAMLLQNFYSNFHWELDAMEPAPAPYRRCTQAVEYIGDGKFHIMLKIQSRGSTFYPVFETTDFINYTPLHASGQFDMLTQDRYFIEPVRANGYHYKQINRKGYSNEDPANGDYQNYALFNLRHELPRKN